MVSFIDSRMKVIDCPRYGPPGVVQIAERPVPRLRRGEALVRVVVSTVNTADARVRAFDMPSPTIAVMGRLALGFRGPRARVLGTEFAGIVHEVASDVSHVAPGDRVVGTLGVRFGAHAEYVARDADSLVAVPDHISLESAVALPFGACTALFAATIGTAQISHSAIQRDMSVLRTLSKSQG